MVTFAETICVALGGAAGALSRFGMQHFSFLDFGKYPNTIAVNLLGCVAIGAVWAILNAYNATIWLNRLVIAGFLGGFTTFSTFALDFVMLAEAGKWPYAIGYASLSMIGGLLLCWAALSVTTRLMETFITQ